GRLRDEEVHRGQSERRNGIRGAQRAATERYGVRHFSARPTGFREPEEQDFKCGWECFERRSAALSWVILHVPGRQKGELTSKARSPFERFQIASTPARVSAYRVEAAFPSRRTTGGWSQVKVLDGSSEWAAECQS